MSRFFGARITCDEPGCAAVFEVWAPKEQPSMTAPKSAAKDAGWLNAESWPERWLCPDHRGPADAYRAAWDAWHAARSAIFHRHHTVAQAEVDAYEAEHPRPVAPWMPGSVTQRAERS